MPRITIYFTDGTAQSFDDRDRQPRVEYRTGFVEVTDTWGGRVAFPAAQVKRVETAAPPRGF